MPKLAEKIGISKRALQTWKNKGIRPRDDSIQLLVKFLESHNGEHYVVRLKQIFNKMGVEGSEPRRGEFPPELDKKDIEEIRNAFPGYNEMYFLCAMTVYNDKVMAAKQILPEGNIIQKASLISSYETAMETAEEVFGLRDVYEWKNKVIRFIGINGQIPEEKGDVEALGQQALDSIISCYK